MPSAIRGSVGPTVLRIVCGFMLATFLIGCDVVAPTGPGGRASPVEPGAEPQFVIWGNCENSNFTEVEQNTICEALEHISTGTAACAEMQNYLMQEFNDGRMSAGSREDVYAITWHDEDLPDDPNSSTILMTTISDFEEEIGNTLRHEYGHIHEGYATEAEAEAYTDHCTSEA